MTQENEILETLIVITIIIWLFSTFFIFVSIFKVPTYSQTTNNPLFGEKVDERIITTTITENKYDYPSLGMRIITAIGYFVVATIIILSPWGIYTIYLIRKQKKQEREWREKLDKEVKV